MHLDRKSICSGVIGFLTAHPNTRTTLITIKMIIVKQKSFMVYGLGIGDNTYTQLTLKVVNGTYNGLSGLVTCLSLIRLIRYNNPLTALEEYSH